jgi:hypothetical protein
MKGLLDFRRRAFLLAPSVTLKKGSYIQLRSGRLISPVRSNFSEQCLGGGIYLQID